MTDDIRDRAQAEAERQAGTVIGPGRAHEVRRYDFATGFAAGAEWGHSQVEQIARSIAQTTVLTGQPATEVVEAARRLGARTVEYGILRPASMPDMSGKPQYTQIVSATFATRDAAELALRNVPALRDREAIILRRTAPGEWEADR